MSDSKEMTITPRTFAEVQSMAETLSKSSLLPDALKGKVPDLVFSILAGAELGLSPLASIRGVHVIQGRPSLSADVMVGLALGSGKAVYFERVEESDVSVTYETMRVGATKPRRCTWTIDMAKRGALHQKENWRLFPRAMLAARAKAELARDVYSDILAGCYDPDEIDHAQVIRLDHSATESRHADVVDAVVVEPDHYIEALKSIAAASTPDELRALAKTLSKLEEPQKEYARASYKQRMQELETPRVEEPAQ